MPTDKKVSEMRVDFTTKGVKVSSYDVMVYGSTGGAVRLSMTGEGIPYNGLADLVSHVANLAARAEYELRKMRQKKSR
jgi:hypothetical protein